MTDVNAKFNERVIRDHAAAVERGEHDDQCEWRPGGYWICNCSKRQRERVGYTTPPGELDFPPPICPRCLDSVQHDGDHYTCYACKVYWMDNYTAVFFDDHGDLMADLAKWEAAQARRSAS